MPVIIGVRFNNAGKVYYFDPGSLTMKYHDHVIVETARGTEYGTVVISPTEVPEEKAHGPLKKVIRMATPDDDERERTNREKEKDAYRTCKKKIAEHGLDMKLIGAEYTFDNSKLLFYFTAEGRIDFRELVKDLAGIFRTRIELRQIGVRDETKLLGGRSAATRGLMSSRRSPSRWPRTRTCRSIRQRYPAPAGALCAVLKMRPRLTRISTGTSPERATSRWRRTEDGAMSTRSIF